MKNREELKFEDTVRASFSYLVDEYSFKCMISSPTYIRYERKDIFISIHHGRASYEVGLAIGLNSESKDHGYGIGSFISISDGGNNFKSPVAKTKKHVEKYVQELSTILLRYAFNVLGGDLGVFDKLKIHINEYWNKIQANDIKRKAKISFSKGDYDSAKKFYRSVSKFLTASEIKKLEISEKRSK